MGRRRQEESLLSQAFRQFALTKWRRCQWCNVVIDEKTATTDHLIPRSRSGTWNWKNLVLACWPCNQQRKNAHADSWHLGPRWRSEEKDSVALEFGPFGKWAIWKLTELWERQPHEYTRTEATKIVRRCKTGTYLVLPTEIDPDSFESGNFTKCHKRKE